MPLAAGQGWVVKEYNKSGKKLDMSKGCVRLKKSDDLALDVVGRIGACVHVQEHIANYRAARALLGKGTSRSNAKKSVRKAAVGERR
jgi:hypothetical protein